MLEMNLWISELAKLMGVSTRTIRYYIEEGLLPQPEVQGKYAVFNADYLVRLKLIKYLKDAYLPLREIKRQLDSLTVPDVYALVERFEKDPSGTLAEMRVYPSDKSEFLAFDNRVSAPPDDSASEYIQRALKRQNPVVREPVMKFNAPAPSPAPNPAPQSRPSEPTETWQRVELAPGVELNVRQPQPPALRFKVDYLITFAKNLFNKREDPK